MSPHYVFELPLCPFVRCLNFVHNTGLTIYYAVLPAAH